MTSLDEAHEKFLEVQSEASSNIDEILTEEDAKVQIITRVLTECLGWKFSDIGTERKHQNGFSDYSITNNKKNCLLVEAKRIGRVPILVTDKAVQKNLKLNGPGLIKCDDGILQAASYASPKGFPVAVLTDGDAWVVFKPNVIGEDFLNKQAIVFPSLNAITAKFSLFFDLLGKESFTRKIYNQLFDEIHNTRNLLTSPLVAAVNKTEIYRQQKSTLAFELEPVFDNFFSRMTGEDDPDLIVDCFVETKESRIADHSLEKMTSRVLGNVSNLNNDLEAELSAYISNAVELDSGESVFIVGPTGAGKSTFIERFFKKTLENKTRSKCVPIRLNFLEATGSIDAAVQWVADTLIKQLEAALYENGSPSWNELRGLYYSDYNRQRTGIWAKLYERDKDAFQAKFSEFMAKKVEDDREGYLKNLLFNIVHSRKKLPVIIADNTDEFLPEFKEAIFQFVQSLRIHIKHCIIIFPITDKSAWSFTKTDIYSIYQSKSFFLPTPPPREVFRKRISYLSDKLQSDGASDSNKYLTNRGITISIPNLEKFANVVEEAFVNDEYSAKILGEVSNYNIRRTLRLARRVITSPVFRIEDLITTYASGSATYGKYAKFLNALIKGDYNFYNKDDAEIGEITSVFQVDKKFKQSPLLLIRILALLDATDNAASNVDERHLAYQNLSEYFQVLGTSEAAIDTVVLKMIQSKLIEPFDPSLRDLSSAQRLAISFSGKAHLKLATNNPVFFEQMAMTTEILNPDVTSMIKSMYTSDTPIDKKYANIRSIFATYLIEHDQLEIEVPKKLEHFECQIDVIDQIQGFIITVSDGEINATRGEDLDANKDTLYQAVLATVDFYDVNKGFGFVEIDEIGERCFVGSDVVKSSGLISLSDGDDILCDVGPSTRGPQVVAIHDIQNKPDEITLIECQVVRLRADHYYGFVSLFGRQDDALFHYSLLSEDELNNLSIGTRFIAEVRVNSKNGLPQVRRIDEIISPK